VKAASTVLEPVRSVPNVKVAPFPVVPWRRMVMNGMLLLMLWGGYNTDSYRAFQPDFPLNALDLFHGLRSLLPFAAALLALCRLLTRGPLSLWPLRGPLGLLGFYTVIGLVSSLLMSPDPLEALWWGGQYGSVLLVVWSVLADRNPVGAVSRCLELNWIIVGVLAACLLAAIAFTPSVELHPYGLMRLRLHGADEAEDQLFGMATTRSTGVARYAAIAAITAFGKLWRSQKHFRILWLAVFLASVYGIVYLEARTALLSLIVGVFGLLWLRRGPKIFLVLAGLGALILLAVTGSHTAFWHWLTRGQTFDATLTGRTMVWAEGWDLFLTSPLLGHGFHADRIILQAHMHDALIHALVQAGLIGAIPFMIAIVSAFALIWKLYVRQPSRGMPQPGPEVPGVIAFFTVASITESTFALFGVAWLLTAPCLAYVQALNRTHQEVQRRVFLAKSRRLNPRQVSVASSLRNLYPGPNPGSV